jgi:pimeloyl-ACP methyl ester carboxylesterase
VTTETRDPSEPLDPKRYVDIGRHRLAYIDEGKGVPIVVLYGSPTSSYLGRNVMPSLVGLGRLIATDLRSMVDHQSHWSLDGVLSIPKAV